MQITKAVVLLSGGLDSATVLAIARQQGFACYTLGFDYGQRHRLEIQAAQAVAASLGVVQHLVLPVNLRVFGGSALTAELAVPKNRPGLHDGGEIPVTYVPARNTVFLSLALAWAETLGAYDLFLGVNALDYSGYPDCRPEYIAAFEKLANLATAAGVEERGRFRVHTPLINMRKADIIKTGLSLGVDYGRTLSCYDPDHQGRSCGQCDSCRLRLEALASIGVVDPVRYVKACKDVAP